MAISSATVTAYANNNFNANNVPASPAVLANASTATQLAVINCLPFSGESVITLTLKAWATINTTSYLKIQFAQDNFTYYALVTGFEYTSMDTVVVSAILDGWLTIGGTAGISKISGMTSRHLCLDDDFGKYCLSDEYLTPTTPLVLRGTKELYQDITGTEETYHLVASTIGLAALGSETYNTAIDFEAGENAVTVPVVPERESATRFVIHRPDGRFVGYTIPGYSLYNADNENVKRGIQRARSLGIENGILASYSISSKYVEIDQSQGILINIVCKCTSDIEESSSYYGQPESTDIDFEYGDVMNKRLNYGEYNKFGLVAIGSGNTSERNAEDIYVEGKDVATVCMMCDGRPHGKVYYNFSNILGATEGENFIQGVLTSLEWQTAPINYAQSSGLGVNAQLMYNQSVINDTKQNVETISNIFGAAADTAGGNVGGGLKGFVDTMLTRDFYKMNRAQEQAAWLVANTVVAPQITFAREEGLRDIYGNGVIAYAYGYSETDLARLDKVLNMYGYKDVKPLTKDDLTSGKYFNYVEAHDVHIITTANFSRVIRETAETQISSGIRIWKVNPNPDLYAVSNRPE